MIRLQEAPNITHNYAFKWDGDVIPLGDSVEYPCMENMAVGNDTTRKHNASTSSFVLYYEFIFQTPISVDTNRVYIIYMDSSIFYL